jgi:Lysyl oxidase
MRARRAILALTAGVFVAGCGGGSRNSVQLLPDLEQVPAEAISIVDKDGRERLVFLSAVENAGRGPLLVSGRRPTLGTAEMSASQLVRRADGSATTYPVRSRLRFVVSETHRHWHLLGFESYELRSPDGQAIGRDHKTGFCLGDRYDVDARARIPGEPSEAVWTQECGRGQPKRLEIREGLSPGYGDDYVPLLEGQYIDVTGLSPGRYVLVHRVNPRRDLLESSYANNAASVLLELSRQAAGKPTVKILATCPDSARCG